MDVVVLIIILLGVIVGLVFAVNALWNFFRFKVPFVATPHWVIGWLVENLHPREGSIVYDLGCGDARVLAALKRRFPSIQAIGYEHSWWPYLLAKVQTHRSGIEIRRTDFYSADLRDANVVFCFLITSVMPRVEALLRSSLKPGAVVYSYGFRFPNWRPSEEIANPRRPHGSRLLVYRI